MIGAAMLAMSLAVQSPLQQPERDAAASPSTAADRVTLPDGRTVLGLVTSNSAGPRVGFDMLVRRAWAEAHVPDLAETWNRAAATAQKPAVAERRRRLQAWREERKKVAADDRILAWIDAESDRLSDADAVASTLLPVRIGRDGCRSVERSDAAGRRLLSLAWTSGLADPEEMAVDDLRQAVESRGFLADGTDAPSLDRLKPLVKETDARWLARRAATELAVDGGRRFLRYQGMVFPDPGDGGGLDAARDLGTAVDQVRRLLDPGAATTDALEPVLARITEEGGVGAVVTRLEMAPDLSRVGVDVALWVRGPRGWVEYGSRQAIARPDDFGAGAAAGIAQDPQVDSVFKIVDSLGLGTVTAEMKDRSLRMGAAVTQALGKARSAFAQEIDSLAFPVLESTTQGGAKGAEKP